MLRNRGCYTCVFRKMSNVSKAEDLICSIYAVNERLINVFLKLYPRNVFFMDGMYCSNILNGSS